MEQVGKPACLLDLEQDLASHVSKVQLRRLFATSSLWLLRVFLGNLFKSVQLDNCSLECAAQDDGSIGTLAQQAIKLIFSLVDPIHFKESLELNVGDLRHLTLFASLGWALLLRGWTVRLEIEFSKQIKE